jgi:pimeloyl-ACP methyl ester carboxylesterase
VSDCEIEPEPGVRIHFERTGSGNPVLLGHGLLGDLHLFHHQVPRLAERHQVIRLDFRGHGRSRATPGRWTIHDLAEDYGAVMDRLAVDRAVLVGLSMGGIAALHFAAEHPARVAGLVLIGTCHMRESRWRRIEYRALMRLYARVGPRAFLERRLQRLAFSKAFRHSHPDVVARATSFSERMNPDVALAAAGAVVSRPSLEEAATRVRVPTRLIVGDHDAVLPLRHAQRLQRAIPGSTLHVIRGAGHAVTLERPEETTRLILEFLAGMEWG